MTLEYLSQNLRTMSLNSNNEGKGPLGYSKADKSEITSPLEDKSQAQQALDRLVGDVSQLREENDSMKLAYQQLLNKMEEIIQTVNNQTVALGGSKEIATENQTNVSGLGGIKDIMDSKLGEKIIDRLFPEQSVTPNIIDQDYINAKVKKSIMGNFEVGEALIESLKSKIISKAITKSVSQIVSHEPE